MPVALLAGFARRWPALKGLAICRRTLRANDLGHAFGSLPQSAGNAVNARVAPTNDHNVLAIGIDACLTALKLGACDLAQVFEREMDARKVSTRNADVAWNIGTGGQDDRIGLGKQLVCMPDRIRIADELDAALLHELDALPHDLLGKLHAGDTVAEQAAGTLVPLVYAHAQTTPREFPGKGKPRGTRTDDAHEGRRRICGRKRLHAMLPCVIGKQALVIVNGDRIVMQPEVTGGFARRRAHTPRELRERIRELETLVRLVETPAIEQVVDLGDEITQRTARHGGHVIEKAATLAKRHATIHAATRLLTLLVGGKRQHELPVIRHGLVRGTHAMLFACDLKVCSRASHPTPPLSATRRHAPVPPHERSPLPRAASSWQASCDTRPV